MELPTKVSRFADTHGMFPQQGLILAAVSGGADSICLLAALLELSEKRGFSVAAVHFNHRLRGRESDGDAMFVEEFCAAKGVRLVSSAGDVRQYAERCGIGTEEAARRMRYDFFMEAARKTGAGRIATAHTADDNAETVLLNLARGAGLRGLGGIPPKRGRIIRPMLTVTRREVLEFIRSRALPFVEDSTNSLDIYTRNILRHRVVPVLAEINPRFAESVAVSSSLLREDEAFLTGLARDFIAAQHSARALGGVGEADQRAAGPPRPPSLDARDLRALPRPVSGRVVRLLGGRGLTARHVAGVLALCASDSPSARLSLPGLTVRREYGRIVFAAAEEEGSFAPVSLVPGGTAAIPELGLTATCRKTVCKTDFQKKIHNSFNTFLFKYDNVCDKIVIRPRKTGDKIVLFGGSGSKSLKKLFIERRIPAHRRALVPVIADAAGVLAVRGIGFDQRAFCRPGDTALEIDFKETPHEK